VVAQGRGDVHYNRDPATDGTVTTAVPIVSSVSA
jgi:hypothetical protein